METATKETRFTFWLIISVLVAITCACQMLLTSRTFNPLILPPDYDVKQARQEYEDKMLSNTFERYIKPYVEEQGIDKN